MARKDDVCTAREFIAAIESALDVTNESRVNGRHGMKVLAETADYDQIHAALLGDSIDGLLALPRFFELMRRACDRREILPAEDWRHQIIWISRSAWLYLWTWHDRLFQAGLDGLVRRELMALLEVFHSHAALHLRVEMRRERYPWPMEALFLNEASTSKELWFGLGDTDGSPESMAAEGLRRWSSVGDGGNSFSFLWFAATARASSEPLDLMRLPSIRRSVFDSESIERHWTLCRRAHKSSVMILEEYWNDALGTRMYEH